MQPTHDIHIRDLRPLLPPCALKAELPMTAVAQRTVVEGRQAIQRILRKEDPRLLTIIGPERLSIGRNIWERHCSLA